MRPIQLPKFGRADDTQFPSSPEAAMRMLPLQRKKPRVMGRGFRFQCRPDRQTDGRNRTRPTLMKPKSGQCNFQIRPKGSETGHTQAEAIRLGVTNGTVPDQKSDILLIPRLRAKPFNVSMKGSLSCQMNKLKKASTRSHVGRVNWQRVGIPMVGRTSLLRLRARVRIRLQTPFSPRAIAHRLSRRANAARYTISHLRTRHRLHSSSRVRTASIKCRSLWRRI